MANKCNGVNSTNYVWILSTSTKYKSLISGMKHCTWVNVFFTLCPLDNIAYSWLTNLLPLGQMQQRFPGELWSSSHCWQPELNIGGYGKRRGRCGYCDSGSRARHSVSVNTINHRLADGNVNCRGGNNKTQRMLLFIDTPTVNWYKPGGLCVCVSKFTPKSEERLEKRGDLM